MNSVMKSSVEWTIDVVFCNKKHNEYRRNKETWIGVIARSEVKRKEKRFIIHGAGTSENGHCPLVERRLK